jgi:phosphoribosylglycinamide formyltransferase 1
LKIAVFVSGRGSNLKAILSSKEIEGLVEVKIVLSDKISCPAFQIAESFSIPTYSIGDEVGCVKFDKLISLLLDFKIDLIILAGFLKLIPKKLIDAFRNRIINIHPALLPSFGGKGMYGINVHKAVFESSAKVSGATVHFVDYTYDTGNIIAQRCVDISDVKSPEEIAERVIKIEHELLPFIIKKIALQKVIVVDKRVFVN